MRSPFPRSLRQRATIAKRALISVRLVNLLAAAGVSTLLVLLLVRKSPGTSKPKPELGVLLAFSLITAAQSFITLSLACFDIERLLLACVDLLCICGYVCTAVLLRGITNSYECRAWMGTLEGTQADGADDATIATIMRRSTEDEVRECTPLRSIFGVAILGCFLLLASFNLAIYMVRVRRQIEVAKARAAAKFDPEGKLKRLPRKPAHEWDEEKGERRHSDHGSRRESQRDAPRRERKPEASIPAKAKPSAEGPPVPEKPRHAHTRSLSGDLERRRLLKEYS